jgi:hypothetical protein
VTFPFVPVFLALLLAYMVYSEWAHLDSRYPIAAALVLLVVTAVVDAAGAIAEANTLAEYVFFLLAGGVVLLLVDHVRAGREAPDAGASGGSSSERAGEAEPAEATEERERAAQQSLDRAEQHPVAVVDAARGEDDEQEEGSEPEPEGGKGP